MKQMYEKTVAVSKLHWIKANAIYKVEGVFVFVY